MNVPLTPVRFVRRAVTEYPKKVGVVCGNQRFTYAQFGERAGKLGRALLDLGVVPGERVAFLSFNCHRLLEAYYGVLEAKGVLLPLNIRLAPPELSFILNDAGATVLFYDAEFLPLVEKLRPELRKVRHFFTLDEYDQLLSGKEPLYAEVMEMDENTLAEIFYTSGTTNNPKGVMLTHRNIYLHGLNVIAGLGSRDTTVELHTIPLFHANGWGRAHSVTYIGGKHVMIRRFDPGQVFELVERERVEGFSLVPTMAIALINSPARAGRDLSSLRYVTIGGAASSPELVQRLEAVLGCACTGGYGLTETSPVMTMAQLKDSRDELPEHRHARQATAGCAFPGVEIRVVDEQMRDVPCDGKTVGEVVTRGDGIMAGYWNQPEATAEALKGGWFHTGDLAVMDEDRYILIVDRMKEIIISGGENISSLEVEKALLAHPAVYECAVIPVPDERWGEVPKALVSLKPGQAVTEEELISFCRGRLAGYKVPKSVEFIADLPKSGTGKILKRVLREKYWAHLERRVGV